MIRNLLHPLRPNRLEGAKDEQYHMNYALWCISQVYNPLYRNWQNKCSVNWNFYKGGQGQWIMEEDNSAFLMDDNGMYRNRIQMSENIIKPFINQYLGNIMQMDFNAEARGINDSAKNQMEEQLKAMNFYHQVEKMFPDMSAAIRKNVNLGKDINDTRKLIEATTQDKISNLANMLKKYIGLDVDMEEIKQRGALYMGLFGLCVYHGYESQGKYNGELIQSYQYFWDTACRRRDFTDASFMGHWEMMDPVTIFEMYQGLSDAERRKIENWSQRDTNRMSNHTIDNTWNVDNGRILVFNTYWRDEVKAKFAWVMNEFGYPAYERIDDDMTPYTSKDRMTKKEILKYIPDFDKELEGWVFMDDWRMCKMAACDNWHGAGITDGVVLEWGKDNYEHHNRFEGGKVKAPYVVQTWCYENGEVLTPIDDIIDPQRALNRANSIEESHINNAMGSGPIIDERLFAGTDVDKAQVLNDINNGKAVTLDGRKVEGGVGRAVASYVSQIGIGGQVVANYIDRKKLSVQDQTGVNSAMTGTMGQPGALVGVMDHQLRSGSLVQEPYYYAMSRWLTNITDQQINLGKQIYADNPKQLAVIVGDRGAELVQRIKDLDLEDFRIFTQRVPGEQTQEENGRQLILLMMQMQLIDRKLAAELMDMKANETEVMRAMNGYQKQLAIAEQRSAEAARATQQQRQDFDDQLAINDQVLRSTEIEGKLDNQQMKIEEDAFASEQRNEVQRQKIDQNS